MSAPTLFAVAGAVVFAMAFHGLVVHPHLLRKILALNVMGSSVFLVIGALARRAPGPLPDPLPHALVITGIVVAVAATALAIVLMLRLDAATGRPELPPADQG